MQDDDPTPADDRFDSRLARSLAALPADPVGLSRDVLTRLAAPAPGPGARLAEVLAHPGALTSLCGGALLLAGALGYAALPQFAPPELLLLGQALTLGGF